MNSFFDGSMLLTYSGATLATTLITQFLKSVRWLDRIPTRAVSYIIALAIMVFAEFARGGVTWQEILLTAVNAVVVALAANGAFDSVNAGRKE